MTGAQDLKAINEDQEAIVRRQLSIRMHPLKSLLEVADDEDNEDDPASSEKMTMRSRSLVELTQLIEQAANVKVVAPGDDLRLRQDSRSSMVCRENLQPALFEAGMKHSNVNSPAWSERLFCVLASPVFLERGHLRTSQVECLFHGSFQIGVAKFAGPYG